MLLRTLALAGVMLCVAAPTRAQQPYVPGNADRQDRYREAPPGEAGTPAERYDGNRHIALIIASPVPTNDAHQVGPYATLRIGYRVDLEPVELVIEALLSWRSFRFDLVPRDAWGHGPAVGAGARLAVPFERVAPYVAVGALAGWWKVAGPSLDETEFSDDFDISPSMTFELGTEIKIGPASIHVGALLALHFPGRTFLSTQVHIGPQLGLGLNY